MVTNNLSLPAPILYLRDRFGGDLEVDDGEASITTQGGRIVGNVPECVELVFVNLGTDIVLMRPKSQATATAGIPLQVNGVLSFTVRDDGILPTLDWYAVANSGTQDVYWFRLNRFNQTARA